MTATPRTPINVALVGCGAVSEFYYAPALRELEKIGLVRIASLVDPNAERTSCLKEHFVEARMFGDLGETATEKIDLAIVASPPRFHAHQTIHLLQSGIPVLCEKPMAATLAEAEAMVEAASASRRVLAIGLFRRFFSSSQTIRNILSQTILGEVQSFHFSEGGEFRWPVKSDAYFQRSAAAGGVLMDIGSHLLDLVVWWMGEPSEVRYEDDAMGGIEVNCQVQLKFPHGFAGTIRLSRDCKLTNRYVIQCSKGWLSCNANEADKIQMHFNGTKSAFEIRLHQEECARALPDLGSRTANSQQSFIAQLRNVVAAVRGEENVFVSGKDALAGFRLIDRCYRQRNLLPMAWLDEREQARAQQLYREITAC